VKLARENLEQIEGFLSLNYKYWVKQVLKHNQSKEDVSVSVSGVGGDDIKLHAVTENECDNDGIENRETDKEQSDMLSADTFKSVEMGREMSRKRKLLEEASDNDDREVVHSGEIEGDLQKSVTRDKKRKKLEDGLEVEVDMSPDTDVNSTVNDTQSEFAVKRSVKPEIDMELEDVSEGKAIKDNCTDVTKDGGDTETEKTSDRNKNLHGVSSQNEEGSVAENSVEYTSLLHETAIEPAQSETNYSGNGSTVYEVDNRSEKSFESLSTLCVQHHGRDLPTCEVSDFLVDLEKTAVYVDALQENQPRKSNEHDYAKLNVKSEAKHENSDDVAAVDKGCKNKDDQKISENDSSSDDETIEFLFDNECEKSQSDEGEDNEKNDKLDSVESLADDSKSSMKRLPEENQKTDREGGSSEDTVITLEIPDSVGKDPVAAVRSHGVVMEGSEEDEDFEVQTHITGSNESNGEENKMDTSEEPEKYIEKKDEKKKKLESDHEEDKSSYTSKLEVSDMSVCEGKEMDGEKGKVEMNEEHKLSDTGELEMSYLSECEGKEMDGEKDKVEVNEDETGVKDKLEEETMDAFNYTEDCIKAQQALLDYSTDDEDSCTETCLRKKKRMEQSKKAKEKEVAVCKDKKPAKKQCYGPKSRTRRGKGSTTTSSVSSATDVDSECSVRRQDIKADGGRRKKFRLKDTEAYKQDEKLGWKCTVPVERLPDEVFQKHYEQYYSDEENECEKNAKDDKEIDR
jgi:hypothetical protein